LTIENKNEGDKIKVSYDLSSIKKEEAQKLELEMAGLRMELGKHKRATGATMKSLDTKVYNLELKVQKLIENFEHIQEVLLTYVNQKSANESSLEGWMTRNLKRKIRG